MRAFKFYPENKAKFHFGNSKAKIIDSFSSDQLFSALFNCAVLLYGEDKAVKLLSHSLPTLSFSSLFWGLKFIDHNSGECKEIFFLPRPLAPFKQYESQNLLLHKKTKKIKYFSLEAFKLLQRSWQKDIRHFTFNLLDLKVIGEKFACTNSEIKSLGLKNADIEDLKFFTIQSNPRLVVSRVNDQSENFYYQEALEIIYQQVNGYEICPFMYFFYQGELNQRLEAVI
ncbi:MAG: hypothetical protein GX273_08485, partial [Bacteroidales bacterium]|nr:hypothetical protein [Bacteroidales bacterium]